MVPRFLQEGDVTLAPTGATRTMTLTAVGKGMLLPALYWLLSHNCLTTTEIYLNLSLEDTVHEFREKW